MKLFYTTTSPYARKARIVAIETGVAERLELVRTTVRDPGSALLRYNPTGKVPAFQTDDGSVLCESFVICDYLDSLHAGRRLVPVAGAARWEVLQFEGLAAGLLEGLVTLVREFRRAKSNQSPELLELETNRAGRCLDAFEAEAAADRMSVPLHLGQITLACALGLLDFRLPSHDWRAGRPKLAAWFATFAERPSMEETALRES